MKKKLIDNAKNIQTTTLGVVGLAVTIAVTWGKLSFDEAETIKELSTEVISGLTSLSLILLARD